MQSWESNPFAVLTFIVAPAIMTNASSVMSLGTSNRLARAMERARAISSHIEGHEGSDDPEIVLRLGQLRFAERRALLLVRSLTAFYASVGSFSAAALISLVGAVFFVVQWELPRDLSLWLALFAGVGGVGGLVCGTGLLVAETRLALRMLTAEIKFQLGRPYRPALPVPPA